MLCLAASLLLPWACIAQAEPSPAPPTFAETPCDLPGVSPEIRPRLRCGMVGVPQRYDRPNAGEFKLAVVVVRSGRQPALPDPVLYISGGPGSPLTIYAEYQARHPYAPDRDLVLVDQRGTGRSEPSLCPELEAEFVTAMLSIVTDQTPEALATSRAVHAACRVSIVARGIDPNGFGTLATVADYERVRRALGVARWNVVGESYGTTVAMTLMATLRANSTHRAPIALRRSPFSRDVDCQQRRAKLNPIGWMAAISVIYAVRLASTKRTFEVQAITSETVDCRPRNRAVPAGCACQDYP